MRLAIGPLSLALETVQGEPVRVGNWQVVPLARTVSVLVGRDGMPGGAGFVWTWPVAARVTGGGQAKTLRILNVNRLARLAVVMVALGAVGLGRATGRRERGMEGA